MSSFSQIYMNSKLVKSMVESIPESEREAFVEHLRLSMQQYDYLAGVGWGDSSIAKALAGSSDEIPNQVDRRPPRRR